ncbi:Ig-like domain-containing protein [Alteromonas facilis]|uniref:Ig-like domain-containing protein n=1 Tax=Alteromonas facilis TaxID=2048004 RepID=UPI000C288EFD|nr:Ig-like domain-containing protein [Alteromonas facilis]
MTSYRYLLISLVTLLLAACNGSSGENGEAPFDDNYTPPEPVVALVLEVLDANCAAISVNSFAADETACIQATLTEDGVPLGNQIIEFTSAIGVLDIESKVTNQSGIAQVFLSAQDGLLGAGSVSASYSTLQDQAAIEFVASDNNSSAPATLSLTMFNQVGDSTLRFKADQQVRLQAMLLSADGAPVENEILTFSVTRGNLAITDVLTNAQGMAEVVLTAETDNIGAGIATVTIFGDDTDSLVNTLNYEIQSVDAVEQDVVRIGYFENDVFFEDVLGVTGASSEQDIVIGAGATLGLLVGLADADDNPIVGSTPITFSSSCVTDGKATIDENVATVNGRASSTYEDINCASGAGNDDIITATVLVNNTPLTISRSIELLPESIGSIEFVTAEPSSIVLQGTGGQGSASVSTVTFQVNGELGNPLAQKAVQFELSTTVGGLSLSPAEGLTNSQGQVSTRVTAGNVPTAVRVSASTTTADNTVISTQSDILTVNTGLPDQNSFSLSTSNPNPEAASINGQQVTVTAYLADAFNNPVPDGTAVSFTTEGGQIQPSCTTLNGSCSVEWTSADPRVDDHRVTVLATAIGHETLYDSNGNNVYDDEDGGALNLGGDSGFGLPSSNTTGFADISEAWRDDNENDSYDAVEVFLDYDGNGTFSQANAAFDGPQCQANNCGANGLHVRRALVMIMASSNALISVLENNVELVNNYGGGSNSPVLNIARGESASFTLRVRDTAEQTMPSDTSVLVETSSGSVAGQTDISINKNNRAGGSSLEFVLTNDLTVDDDPINATVSITVTSPSGVVSGLTMIVRLL